MVELMLVRRKDLPLSGLEVSEPAELSEDVLFRCGELVEPMPVKVVMVRRKELDTEGVEVRGKKDDVLDALEDVAEWLRSSLLT